MDDALDPLTGGISARHRQVLVDGITTGWRSPSEARLAGLWAAAAAGHSLREVIRRIETGAWPGLASLYARPRRQGRFRRLLTREWGKAVSLVRARLAEKRPGRGRGDSTDHVCNTSRRNTPPHPPGRVRDWVTAVRFLVEHNRLDPHAVVVLTALAEAALKSGTAEVAHGTRSLAIATGLDHVTVSRVVSGLREETDPLIVRTSEAAGTQADVYELRIPADLEPAVACRRWSRGKIHARRPAFWVLGLPAGFVYEALVTAAGPVSVLAILERVPYTSKTTIDDALATLAAHGLATAVADGRRTRWIVGPASPLAVADQLGATDLVGALIRRIREQRRIWHEWLLARFGVRGAWILAEPPPEHPDDPDPPPDDLYLAFTTEEKRAMWDDPYWNSHSCSLDCVLTRTHA